MLPQPQIEIVEVDETDTFLSHLNEFFLNLIIMAVIGYFMYKVVRDGNEVARQDAFKEKQNQEVEDAIAAMPPLRRDFTLAELREFDGTQDDGIGRILIAVNGKVFDVTKSHSIYGPGGPYAIYAGRDASRNLATFSVTINDSNEYDDLSDFNVNQMESLLEWDQQFTEQYPLVGKLLRDFEQHTNYDDEIESEPEMSPQEMENDEVDDFQYQFNEDEEKKCKAEPKDTDYDEWPGLVAALKEPEESNICRRRCQYKQTELEYKP